MSDDAEVNSRLKKIEDSLAEIKVALTGALGGPGLVAIVADQNKRIAKLEAEKLVQRGVTIVVTLIGSGIMTLALRALWDA